MPSKKNIVTRISLEARNKLAELSKEKGVTNVDIIDYILGTSSKESLQRLRNALDQDNKNWDNWIKQVKSTASSWNRRGFRYDTKNAKPSLEIAKKILKDMRSFERSNEPLDKYNEYFDRYRERHIELIKEKGSFNIKNDIEYPIRIKTFKRGKKIYRLQSYCSYLFTKFQVFWYEMRVSQRLRSLIWYWQQQGRQI